MNPIDLQPKIRQLEITVYGGRRVVPASVFETEVHGHMTLESTRNIPGLLCTATLFTGENLGAYEIDRETGDLRKIAPAPTNQA